MTTDVTEEMIDRVMAMDVEWQGRSCPLCGYEGLWERMGGVDQQRRAVRELLQVALASEGKSDGETGS